MAMNSCVILLNWNGWKDTIECLESVFRLNSKGVQVIVCDNASADASLNKLSGWAKGEVFAQPQNPDLARLSSPPVPKPIPCIEISRQQAESEGARSDAPLILIRNGANLGFAGGVNVGLRFALSNPDIQYFWILNNDTVVEPGALDAMIRLLREQPAIGLCGSLTFSYHDPKIVQAEGGKFYSLWTGRVPHRPQRTVNQLDSSTEPMNYVNGASMLVSRAFLERIGLMEESYFLYFEETDWAMRARGEFTLGYARESVVYHKEGAAIGSSGDRRNRSLLSEQYLSRNRVLFTRRFVPWALPTVLLSLGLAAVHRLCSGDPARATAIWVWGMKGLLTPRNKPCKPQVSL